MSDPMTRNRFALLFGVLGWGVTCGLLFAWLMSMGSSIGFETLLLINLPMWCVGGWVWGLLMWQWRAQRLQRVGSD